MPTDIEISNALMAWAALDHACEVENSIKDPRASLTVKRAQKSHSVAVALMGKRGIFKCGHLFERAKVSWRAHLALNLAIYEADPNTGGYDACLPTGELLYCSRAPKVRP